MFYHGLLMLTLSAFLGGGLHGVVVQKSFKPLPVVHSLGMEGIFRLELRDDVGKLHRQMVSQEIFALYEVGDYFDDSLTTGEVRRRQAAAAARAARVAALKAATVSAAEEKRVHHPKENGVVDARSNSRFLSREMVAEREGF